MNVKKNCARQYPAVAWVDINAADLVNGTAVAAIDLPGAAVVLSGSVDVLEPFNSGSADVLDVGDAQSGNRYLNDGNVHAAGRIALVPTGYEHQGTSTLTVTWAGSGAAPTVGKVRLTVQYFVPGRADFIQR